MGWPTDADIERNRINQAERDIVAMEQTMCRFCGGAGTFDDDPEVPGSVTECTWCNGTGDQQTEKKFK